MLCPLQSVYWSPEVLIPIASHDHSVQAIVVVVVVVVGPTQQISKLIKLTFPILITPYVLSTHINWTISVAVCVITSVDPQGTYVTFPGFTVGPTNLYVVQSQGTAVVVVVVVAPQHPSNVVLILVMSLLILIIWVVMFATWMFSVLIWTSRLHIISSIFCNITLSVSHGSAIMQSNTGPS